MKVHSLATLFLSSVSTASAYWKGINVAANNPDGSCKTQDQWGAAFEKLKSLPGYFTSVRVFASSDCNTLANAVPAAIASGSQILVGVWARDDAHFDAEKQALLQAIQQHGHDWIVAISVGSEDRYRNDLDPNKLAQEIYDVRGMVRAQGVNVDVGHVDTWTAWVDASNEVVIQACDFVGMDGYPYFQNSSPEDAANVFWQSLQATRDTVNRVKPGTWVWVTETGWPVSGDSRGPAVPSVGAAQAYWKNVGCALFQQAHTFWYDYQDFNANPSFGILDQNQNPAFDLTC